MSWVSPSDEEPVLWGRFSVTIDGLTRRVDGLERHNEEQFGRIRANEQAISTAVEIHRDLSKQVEQMAAGDEGRRQRQWNLLTIVLTSVALPILVSLILVWIHAGSH